MRVLLTVFTLLLVSSSLTACNTIAGAGQDMKQGGQAVENAADRNK